MRLMFVKFKILVFVKIDHGPGVICSPPRDFCKPCFLVRLWYTKTIAIVLTEQFLRLFGPRVENILNIYIFDLCAKKG